MDFQPAAPVLGFSQDSGFSQGFWCCAGQVCAASLWAGVGRTFNPPPTMTALSFIFKRNYIHALMGFERVGPQTCYRAASLVSHSGLSEHTLGHIPRAALRSSATGLAVEQLQAGVRGSSRGGFSGLIHMLQAQQRPRPSSAIAAELASQKRRSKRGVGWCRTLCCAEMPAACDLNWQDSRRQRLLGCDFGRCWGVIPQEQVAVMECEALCWVSAKVCAASLWLHALAAGLPRHAECGERTRWAGWQRPHVAASQHRASAAAQRALSCALWRSTISRFSVVVWGLPSCFCDHRSTMMNERLRRTRVLARRGSRCRR